MKRFFILILFLTVGLYANGDVLVMANEELKVLDNFDAVVKIDSYLNIVNLSVIKLIVITFASMFFYVVRNYLYGAIQKNASKVTFLEEYSKIILDKAKRPLNIIVLVLNLQVIVYVYNNFESFEDLNKLFNILYTIFVTILIYKVVNSIVSLKLQNVDASSIKKELVNVGIKVANFTLLIFGLLFVLYFAGLNLTAVLSGLGIGGLAVALASKDSLANFFGTLSILFSNTFSQGDWIEIDGISGTVVEIGLRATKIRTFDNAMVTVPNQTLANGDIKNWNKRVLGRRIKMSLGVKYDSKSSDIKNAVKDIKEMLQNHPGIATEDSTYESRYHSHSAKIISVDDAEGVKRTLLVFLDEFSASSINILVYCFSKSVNWAEWLEVKEDVMHKIMEIFEKNNLEFAFPSMSLYHENQIRADGD